jgi:hypothetical protein
MHDLAHPRVANRVRTYGSRLAYAALRTTELLTTFALQTSGEGGARGCKAGAPISPDALMRILYSLVSVIGAAAGT